MIMKSELNKEQFNAVINGDGPVIVVAGAGSGKTRVLTYRVVHLIKDKNISPYNILAITFTNKAAKEMSERINSMTPYSQGMWMCTFHSMCVRILRQDIDKLGYDKNFSIYSEIETDKVLKAIISDMNLNKDIKGEARYEISKAKEKALLPSRYRESKPGYELYAEIYARYEDQLERSNALDFDDLLLKTVQLFARYPDVLRRYQERFKYILIDEFQDTNNIQYMLIKFLGEYNRNVFAVGDEDQSIYGWRGANIGNFREFNKDFPEVKIYKLEQNYRSTSNILNCANRLIDNNAVRIKKNLWTEKGDGAKVEYRCLSSDRDEANYVISNIASLVKCGYKYSDFAILVRANSLTRLFEEGLNLYGYPYKVFGGFKFYERKEIKDIVAYLRIISNPRDNEAILRVINFPKRGIGDKAISSLQDYCVNNNLSLIDGILGIESNPTITNSTINKIKVFRDLISRLINASNTMTLDKLIDYVIEQIDIEHAYDKTKSEDDERLDNIGELVSAIKQFHAANYNSSVSEYLQSVSLMSDTDAIAEGEYITIATIHSSKGLEFRVVFIVGLEEGIFPSSLCMDNPDQLEEERRVMYVATTRAEERLIMSSASSRFRYNEVKVSLPSRFVNEMGFVKVTREPQASHSSHTPKRTVTNYQPTNYSPSVLQEKASVDLTNYKTGAKVVHNRFGNGLIIEMKGNNVAAIAFDGLGIKEFDLSIAPIKLKGE